MKAEDEKTFYRSLYQFADGKKSIVLEKSTEQIYFRKEMTIYNRGVYDYLWQHPSPHIPHIHELLEKDGALIVIEEYVPGENLETVLEERSLSEKEAKQVLLEVCKVLETLHGAHPPIIHRDIKPSNIMICMDGNVKLIDFNASKIVNDEKREDTTLMGTPGYAAPEQFGFGQSEVRTDVYGVGMLLELLLGKYKQYRRIIEKATMVDVEKRYKNISFLKEDISHVGEFPWIPAGFHKGESRIKTLILDIFYVFSFILAVSIAEIPSGKAMEKGFSLQSDSDFCLLYPLFFAWIWITGDWARICRRHEFLNRQIFPIKAAVWALMMTGIFFVWVLLVFLVATTAFNKS